MNKSGAILKSQNTLQSTKAKQNRTVTSVRTNASSAQSVQKTAPEKIRPKVKLTVI